VSRLRLSLPLFLAGSAVFLAPWSAWLASSLPCRYLSQHWGIAWAGFDTALAATLALTAVAALHRAPWLDRAAVAAATLLGADAWFDVVTSRGAAAVAVATTEAVAVEVPVALLCIWVARRFATPAGPIHHPIATTHEQGAPQ
jgi:ABC-type polysaccharide/polyol phosphate export permease